MKAVAVLGLALSVVGGYEAFKISYLHLTTVESCPTIGPPACYIVLVCYSLMVLAWGGVLADKIPLFKRGFWIGFTPAFILAVLGTSGEIFGFASCPHTDAGLPKCFVSLGFVLLIAAAWLYPAFRKNAQ